MSSRRDWRGLHSAAGLAYLVVLACVVLYGRLAFADAAASREPEISEPYFLYLTVTGLLLALYLAVWTAVLGCRRGSPWGGLAALGGGVVLTTIALARLPLVRFPYDQYAVSHLWLVGASFPLLVTWALVTSVGLRRRPDEPRFAR